MTAEQFQPERTNSDNRTEATKPKEEGRRQQATAPFPEGGRDSARKPGESSNDNNMGAICSAPTTSVTQPMATNAAGSNKKGAQETVQVTPDQGETGGLQGREQASQDKKSARESSQVAAGKKSAPESSQVAAGNRGGGADTQSKGEEERKEQEFVEREANLDWDKQARNLFHSLIDKGAEKLLRKECLMNGLPLEDGKHGVDNQQSLAKKRLLADGGILCTHHLTFLSLFIAICARNSTVAVRACSKLSALSLCRPSKARHRARRRTLHPGPVSCTVRQARPAV